MCSVVHFDDVRINGFVFVYQGPEKNMKDQQEEEERKKREEEEKSKKDDNEEDEDDENEEDEPEEEEHTEEPPEEEEEGDDDTLTKDELWRLPSWMSRSDVFLLFFFKCGVNYWLRPF